MQRFCHISPAPGRVRSVACNSLVLGAQTVANVHNVAELQPREMRDDAVLTAESLATAVSNVWSSNGNASAYRLVQRIDEVRKLATFSLTPITESDKHNARPRIEKLSQDEYWYVRA